LATKILTFELAGLSTLLVLPRRFATYGTRPANACQKGTV